LAGGERLRLPHSSPWTLIPIACITFARGRLAENNSRYTQPRSPGGWADDILHLTLVAATTDVVFCSPTVAACPFAQLVRMVDER